MSSQKWKEIAEKRRLVEQYYKEKDQRFCIAHLSAEDMLKPAVTEVKKLKHSLRVGADNPFGPKL